MFFLNLSFVEFAALLGGLSSAVFALYLLDRVRKRHRVSTLRFFQPTGALQQQRNARRLQQPWSLLLQLLALVLLVAAAAQLQFGPSSVSGRDHVLILDNSAWTDARIGQYRLIDQARVAARRYVRLLPSTDRVMVVRANALPEPVTGFTLARDEINRAIDTTQPGPGVLKIGDALSFARQAQAMHTAKPGEIAFVGAGRVAAGDLPASLPDNLRLLFIDSPPEHAGITKMGARRQAANPNIWDIYVSVKNYGQTPRILPLVVRFGGATIGSRRFVLSGGGQDSASFRYETKSAGWLESRLLTGDQFQGDRRAVLELPARNVPDVLVYSSAPDRLKALFAGIPGVHAEFLPKERYANSAGINVFDGFAPPQPPTGPSIWLSPPQNQSLIPIRSVARNATLKLWRSDHALGEGLRGKETALETSEIFSPREHDMVVADSDAGPVVVARPSPKMLFIGFRPDQGVMRNELATPLLFANAMRWMEPNIFRTYESLAAPAGALKVDLEPGVESQTVRVIDENGRALPFTIDGRTLQFFSGSPGVVRVLTGDRELVYSLTLPQPGDVIWNPASVRHGQPPRALVQNVARDLSPWLAIMGALVLMIEWALFGRLRNRARSLPASATKTPAPGTFRKAS